ncbi:Uu.00g054910.m01.CDS01 [Anthostomella pinea]|uniref:Uu.00g054910.m01.CDS01 n=1 Tax=Anthostomella pinea TaxID=933095 RepID=A0AAI8VR03_9PEZI|nr:Uu.00g054910.m01.CDS01 [Anthostomella pinea]
MPTVQITPTSDELLQRVADTVGKTRRMVIVTGAGISTSSGIPDFQSENGLYSLIQQQFERAKASGRTEPEDETAEFSIGDSPAKRRRISQPDLRELPSKMPIPNPRTSNVQNLQQESSMPAAGSPIDIEAPPLPRQDQTTEIPAAATPAQSSRRLTRSQMVSLPPSLPTRLVEQSTQSSPRQESVFSALHDSSASSQTGVSPRCSDSGPRGSPTRASTPKVVPHGENFTSSPLSSPPPVLFDPYDNANTTTDSSSEGSSACSETSDSDYTHQSFEFISSQTSNSNLRNMKGRDLFDCNIWADPLKTAVFYQFATSLRQKAKDVEPTTTHRFIARMRDVGKLARVYTQNIDEIEKKIGLSTDLRHGAGNKRRKSAKQQLAGPDKDAKGSTEAPNGDDDDVVDTAQAAQDSEDAIRNKLRSSPIHDKGVECVFLHGSLHALRCFACGKRCNWDQDGRELRTMSGQQPECPHCAGATAARQEKGKRALGVGKLRPDIVLYGEDNPQNDLISRIWKHDVSAGPDLLLILGTSLRVHGLKAMVKDFAKSVHSRGGKVVFVNLTKPSESAWGDVIDYWIEWDCDAWVQDLQGRKPRLWLSSDEIQELDKQKRDALAEKKRESLKKRKDLLEKRRHTIEVSKSRPPPKNPSAMRNDYGCGAYVIWDIFQALAVIGNRPFDNLGYIPSPSPAQLPAVAPSPAVRPKPQPVPQPESEAAPELVPIPKQVEPIPKQLEPTPKLPKQAKTKKPRKSATAALTAKADSTIRLSSSYSGVAEQEVRPAVKANLVAKHVGKDQYVKAAKGLERTGKQSTSARMAVLTPPPVSSVLQGSSITAAVKTNPRRRKRKAMYGCEDVGHTLALSRPRPTLPPQDHSYVPSPEAHQAGKGDHAESVLLVIGNVGDDGQHHSKDDHAEQESVPLALGNVGDHGRRYGLGEGSGDAAHEPRYQHFRDGGRYAGSALDKLPPLNSNWEHSPPKKIEPWECPVEPPPPPKIPVAGLRPTLGCARTAQYLYDGRQVTHPMVYSGRRQVTHPMIYSVGRQVTHPMIYSDPLVGLQYSTNQRMIPHAQQSNPRDDSTPSPSDQLHWEIQMAQGRFPPSFLTRQSAL